MNDVNISKLADNLSGIGIGSAGPERARLAVDLLRELAKGEPVTLQRAIEIGADHGVPAQIIEASRSQFAEVDDSGSMVGIAGFTLKPTQHRYLIGDKTFYTWCTLDGLYLAPLLDADARIETTSPGGVPIAVEVSPSGVKSVEPTDAVLSIVLSKGASGPPSVSEIRAAFCHFVRFFESEDAFAQWRPKDQEVVSISVEQGFELGRLLNGDAVTGWRVS